MDTSNEYRNCTEDLGARVRRECVSLVEEVQQDRTVPTPTYPQLQRELKQRGVVLPDSPVHPDSYSPPAMEKYKAELKAHDEAWKAVAPTAAYQEAWAAVVTKERESAVKKRESAVKKCVVTRAAALGATVKP
jgi:hypothetical protein